MAFKVGLITGHGAGDSGAVNTSYGKEADFVREIAPMIKKVLDAYCEVSILDTSRNWYKYLQSKDYDFSKFNYILELHMNAAAKDYQGNGNTTGTEIYVTNAEKGTSVEQRIVDKIASIGFKNRGVKRKNFLVINAVKADGVSSALLEICFIDDKDDMELFIKKKSEIASAVALGIAEGFGLKKASASETSDSIKGKSKKSASVLQKTLEKNNPRMNPRFKNIASEYIRIGEIYGIKGDVAFCQMAHETGWLKFGGQVKEEQNNFAGIGATNGGASGASFSTIEEGVKAHIQHLYAYCCKDALPSGEKLVDPRFHLVTRGIAPNWVDLNGRWAVPGKTYGQSILKNYNSIDSEQYPKWKAFGSKWYWYTSPDEYAKAEKGQWKAIFTDGKKYFVDAAGVLVTNVAINSSGEVIQNE